MCQRETKADRGTVVEDVDGETLETDCGGEVLDHLCQIVELVSEMLAVGRNGEAEARQVRRHHMIAVGKQGNEVAEHMRRGWEPVQQQKRRMKRIARLSIKNRRGPDLYVAIAYFGGGLGHCRSPLRLALIPGDYIESCKSSRNPSNSESTLPLDETMARADCDRLEIGEPWVEEMAEAQSSR